MSSTLVSAVTEFEVELGLKCLLAAADPSGCYSGIQLDRVERDAFVVRTGAS